MTRRSALAAFAMFAELMASTRDADAQTPATPARAPIKFDLPNLAMDGWEVTISHVDFAPGRVGSAHRHAGFVLAYVLKGEILTKISAQGPAKIYKAGEMFFEPPGSVHEESGNPSQTEPAQLLAMIFAKKGSTLTTPVGRGGDE
ncbi:MAG TPA: cupin domain-containing protein [Vicinamibacterales bacterium]|nr:cupin domain-containing protein [Vicinamibacterales bacterium]